MLRSREIDLLILEDIGRLIRGPAAHRLCGIAVDHGTRVISPNDFIDTAEESWEQDVLEACQDHMKHNAHTSRRLKQKLMNRFLTLGAATSLPIFGYIKPPGAKTFDDWRQDLEYEEVIREGKALLIATRNGSAVATFFNDRNIPTGPYAKKKRWDGTMVLRFYRNSLLKGMPGRGFRHTVKHNESGHRHSVRNPKGPGYRHCPHLAFFDEAEFDALQVVLQEINGKYARKKVRGVDPRLDVPKQRTRALGQHARCWYCGRHYVWGGNGITNNLMCSGARDWKCWNSIGFNGPLAATRIIEAIIDRLDRINGVDDQFRQLVRVAREGGGGGIDARRAKLRRDQEILTRQIGNITSAIAQLGLDPILTEKFEQLKSKEKLLLGEQHAIDIAEQSELELPDSTSELRDLLKAELRRLAINSLELGELIRQLVPEFHVYLVRLADGGHLLPRAKVRLNLLGSFSDAEFVPGLQELLAEELTLDLFVPPERELIRETAVRLDAAGHKQRDIAAALLGQPTQTAVWKALKLQRLMAAQGLESPYVLMHEPPADYKKLRRHKNRNYHFEMLEGYERPTL